MTRARASVIAIVLGAVIIGIFWGLRIQRETLQPSDEVSVSKSTLQVLSYPNLLSENLLKEFHKRSGVRVIVHETANPEELWDRLEASVTTALEPLDLVPLFSFQVPLAAQLGRIQPISESRINNLSAIAPDFRHIPGEHAFRNVLPVLWGLIGFVHPENLTPPPRSWSEIFKQTRLKKKVGLPSSTTLLWTLSDIANPGKDLKRSLGSTLANVLLASDFLSAASLVRSDPNLQIAAVNHGETAFEPFQQNGWKFVLPEEGASMWTLSFALHPESKSISETYDFLNFLLEQDAALELSQSYRQASTNRELESSSIDARLKPSHLRQISISNLEIPKDFSRARELREVLGQTSAQTSNETPKNSNGVKESER